MLKLDTIDDVLAVCKERKIVLYVANGELRSSGPRGAMTAAIKAYLKTKTPELLVRLAAAPPEPPKDGFSSNGVWYESEEARREAIDQWGPPDSTTKAVAVAPRRPFEIGASPGRYVLTETVEFHDSVTHRSLAIGDGHVCDVFARLDEYRLTQEELNEFTKRFEQQRRDGKRPVLVRLANAPRMVDASALKRDQ